MRRVVFKTLNLAQVEGRYRGLPGSVCLLCGSRFPGKVKVILLQQIIVEIWLLQIIVEIWLLQIFVEILLLQIIVEICLLQIFVEILLLQIIVEIWLLQINVEIWLLQIIVKARIYSPVCVCLPSNWQTLTSPNRDSFAT